jgi:peptidoglycan/xylan/chitin deacetylase (PgdA/CDA1 family)
MSIVAERTSAARQRIPRGTRTLLLIFAGGLFCPINSSGRSSSLEPEIQVPILVYHRFGPTARNEMTVTTAVFQSQMQQLVTHGYTVISLQRLIAYFLGNGAPPPACSVVITADDGHRSIYTDMAPVVEKYGLPVTLFVYPSAISNAAWALIWEQLEQLKATGLFDIQSHTFWHPNFREERKRLDPVAYERFVEFQLTRSKAVLERRLGIRVNMLAWPFGIYDDRLMRQAQQAGYVAGFTLERRAATPHEPLLALPRYLVLNSDSGLNFERLLGCNKR